MRFSFCLVAEKKVAWILFFVKFSTFYGMAVNINLIVKYACLLFSGSLKSQYCDSLSNNESVEQHGIAVVRNSVSNGAVSGETAFEHPKRHRDFGISVIIDDDFSFPVIQPMQSTGIL